VRAGDRDDCGSTVADRVNRPTKGLIMSAFAHTNSAGKGLVVLAFPLMLALWLAPSALADPPTETRDVTADDGSTFSVTYKLPPKAEGIASSFKIVPDGDAQSEPADGYKRFVYHEALITRETDTGTETVLQYGNAADTVGRNHPLVTISYQGVDNTKDTIYRTGFYLPAKPTK
jgi:hypothetical protein